MDAKRTCSFCGTSEGAVRRLFEGPRALVCDECVKLCMEIFAKHTPGRPRANRTETLACSFCGRTEDEVDLLIAGPTVFICDGCGARYDKELPA